jgi:hypothetical protein
MDTSQDRRQFRRQPFQARVTIGLPTPQASVKAYVLDLSRDGVRLICAKPVSEGEDDVLTFRMRSRRGIQIEEVPGRVIHVRMDDDAWVVGVIPKCIRPPVRTPPDQDFVQDNPEGVDVGQCPAGVAVRLLRRDVGRRAEDLTRLGEYLV